MTKNPILYDRNMNRKGVFAPADISVTQNARPLSVATLTYDDSVANVEALDFVQIFFPDETFEYYRVKTVVDSVGELPTRALEHSIVWLEDYVCTEKVKHNGKPRDLLEKLLSYAENTRWRLGRVEYNEDIECEFDHANVMQGVIDVLDLCEGCTYSFDQTGEEWVLNLVKMHEEAECEGRLSRNLVEAVVNVDLRSFATRLFVPGKTWHMDSESQAVWGVRESVLNAETKNVDDEELKEQCRKYFKENSTPPISIQIEAHELGRMTGQEFDWFTPGKLCRLCLMDYNGTVVVERINSRTYPKLMTEPDLVVLNLANKLQDTSSELNGLSVTTKTLATRVETKLSEVWVGIEEIEGQMTSEFNRVAILLDAQSARIDLKAEQTQVNTIESRITGAEVAIDGANAEIELKVDKNGIIGAINLSSEEITIQSSKINLSGYVTASELEVVSAKISNLISGVTTATLLKTNTLIVGGTIMGKRTIEVSTPSGTATIGYLGFQ